MDVQTDKLAGLRWEFRSTGQSGGTLPQVLGSGILSLEGSLAEVRMTSAILLDPGTWKLY